MTSSTMPKVRASSDRQEIVAVEGLFDRGVVLAGVADIDLVQAPLHLDDVLGMALDIARLTLEAARGLMQQNAGVGGKRLGRFPRCHMEVVERLQTSRQVPQLGKKPLRSRIFAKPPKFPQSRLL